MESSENERESITGNQEPRSKTQNTGSREAPKPKSQLDNGATGNGWSGNGTTGRGHSPSSVVLPMVEPWTEPVDGAQLLDGVMGELQRFVVFPKWAAETFTMWILHTFAFLLRDVTTYIGIESPEKECGKSTLVTVLSHFVNRAAVSSNISSSCFFRAIEELQPTLLIDEADTNLRGKEDLTGILNAGYTKPTAFVWRICYEPAPGSEGTGEETQRGASSAGRVARYSCWCPKFENERKVIHSNAKPGRRVRWLEFLL